jgi:hypothetical protein
VFKLRRDGARSEPTVLKLREQGIEGFASQLAGPEAL